MGVGWINYIFLLKKLVLLYFKSKLRGWAERWVDWEGGGLGNFYLKFTLFLLKILFKMRYKKVKKILIKIFKIDTTLFTNFLTKKLTLYFLTFKI